MDRSKDTPASFTRCGFEMRTYFVFFYFEEFVVIGAKSKKEHLAETDDVASVKATFRFLALLTASRVALSTGTIAETVFQGFEEVPDENGDDLS